MSKAVIRAYRPEDRDAVRHVCFQTGLMGEPVADQYRDFESFADMFSSYYTDAEPENAFVVDLDGKVVGYILGCRDAQKAWEPMRIALRHVLLRGVCFRPGTAGFYWRGIADMFRDLGKPRKPKFDLERYPSHTHNNLLPEGRRGGMAQESFFHFFDRMKQLGSPGLHGEVIAENKVMLEYAQKKLGYRLHGEPYPVPGLRNKDGSRINAQLVLRDLEEWVPGAWRHRA